MDTDKCLNTVAVVVTLLTKLNVFLVPKAETEPFVACVIRELINSYLKVNTVGKIYGLRCLESCVRVGVGPDVIAFLINRYHCKSISGILITGYGVHNVRISVKILRLDCIDRPIAVCCRNGYDRCNESSNEHCRNKQH